MHSTKNLILIGLRGSGKSTLGKALALKLNKKFVDLDSEIEKEANLTISEIVRVNGWDYFRDLETKICEKFSKKENLVIATGGGIILRDKNIKNLKKNGKIIFIKCPIEICAKRIKNSKNRPSLTAKNFVTELKEIWEQRKIMYEKASNFVIEDDGKKSVKELVLTIINSKACHR
ncbi:MAG: shikimate kinase [Candidatus Woesearchaeota archaeon]|jgi:shikimate kinase